MNKICFVVMPFADDFDGVWQHVIQPVVAGFGDVCRRADDIFSPGAIISDILSLIEACDYVIADLSLANPNVYYELGFIHARGKRAILIARHLDALPFDLRHQRVIVYEDSAAGAAALKDNLERYIGNL